MDEQAASDNEAGENLPARPSLGRPQLDGQQLPLPGVPASGAFHVSQSQLHVGPLPTPEDLANYERVQKGLAERIVAMAESEQSHRQELERTDVKEPFALARRGQAIALIAIGLVLGFGVFLAAIGSPGLATIVVSLDLLGLVTVFVTGRASPPTRPEPPVADETRLDAGPPPELGPGGRDRPSGS